MRGVIMETKNGRAVLLTKGGGFVNIKDKGYSIGDKINITSNTGRLCAMAASLVIVCAGIGSYFLPAGYVSVDINPSLMMTLNVYNRVIDVRTFNDDARVLLNKADIKGKSAKKSVEMLINASEEIGYINDNNRDVILEVVPGMIKPDMERIDCPDIELINEFADRETLRMAQNIGISMAKVKAIEEYTEKNGGDMRSNADKFNDKSVKEIRAIMRDNIHSPDMSKPDIHSHMPSERTQEDQNIQAPPVKSLGNQNYNIGNNSFTADKPNIEEIIKPINGFTQDKYEPLVVGNENAWQINPPPKEPYHGDIVPANPNIQPEQKVGEDIPAQHRDQTQITQQEDVQKPPVGDEPIHTEIPHGNSSDPGDKKPSDNAKPNKPYQNNNQTDADKQKPQDNVKDQGNDKSNDNIKPNEPSQTDNQTGNSGQNPEQKPQDNMQNKGNENSDNKQTQPGGQIPDTIAPPDKQTGFEQTPDSNEQGNNASQDNSHGSEPVPPREETPAQNTHAPQDNIQPPNEPPRGSDSSQNIPPSRSEAGAHNEGGNRLSSENIGGQKEHQEMP